MATGDTIWRDRSVARSTIVGANGRLILLDEDGQLALATPGDTGLAVHAKAQILEGHAWTVADALRARRCSCATGGRSSRWIWGDGRG